MKTKSVLALFVGISLLFSLIPAFAADGDLDLTFGGDGKVITPIGSVDDDANAMAIQSDGKIVVVGTFSNVNNDMVVVRYNSDGSLDTSFDTDGIATMDNGNDDSAEAVAIQPDGKIIVAGYSFNGTDDDFAIVRYNTDGSLDTSFDTDGKVLTPVGSSSDQAYGIALQSDGKIVVAGWSSNNMWDFAVVRYNTDGSLDSTFGTGGIVTTDFASDSEHAYDVAIQSDGKIVVVGDTIDPVSFDVDFAVARYNTDGSLDSSFGTDGKIVTDINTNFDSAYGVAVQGDGKIVVAGEAFDSFPSVYRFATVRYNTDGSLDTSFGTGGKVITIVGDDDSARDVVIQSDGKIVVAGWSSNATTFQDFAIARYNTDGSLDTSFDTDGMVTTPVGLSNEVAFGIDIQNDGKIVAAGSSYNGTDWDFSVVRYQNSDLSLVAHYPFDGNANDASTQGNDPTTVSATLTTDRHGDADNAYDFNGTSNYIAIPDSPSLDIPGTITISAWIKPRTASGKYVVNKEDPTYGGVVYSLDIFPGYVRGAFHMQGQGATLYSAVGTTPIVADQWQHIAVTYDGSDIKVFYNGTQDGTPYVYPGNLATSDADLEIGRHAGTNIFDGTIDDVRIYNRALSGTEIRRLMGIIFVDSASGNDANDGLSWSTPKLTIQAAIDTAVPEEDIWVKTGTYPITSPIELNKAVRLIGGLSGTESTEFFDAISTRTSVTNPSIVNGGGSVFHGVHITADSVVDGLYIIGGTASGSGNDGIGGGIFAESGSSIIRNCTVANNSAANWGGGMALFGTQQVSNCTITSNQITSGTGGGHGVSVHGNSTFSNVLFAANGNTAVGYGGGVYISSATPTFTQSNFYQNGAVDGGGIYVADGGTAPVFDRCLLWENNAGNNGGGLYVKNSEPVFKNTLFQANVAGASGGGAYTGTSSSSYYQPRFENCIFGLNQATTFGGGIYINQKFSPEIVNCNLIGNSAGSLGGGLYLYYSDAYPTVMNSILWGNTASVGDPQYSFSPTGTAPSQEQNLKVAYSDIQGGIDNTAPYREGNINQDPNFIDADGPDNNPATWEDNNVRLSPGSPCIDSGIASFAYAGVSAPAIDLDGNARPLGAGYDIGAYEYSQGTAYLLTNPPGGFGDPNNYSTYRMITVPDGVGAGLYAGIWGNNGAKIFKYDSGLETWNDITPTADPNWSMIDNAGVNSLYTVGGYLFAATYNGVTGTQIWRYGSTWSYWTIEGFGLAGSAYSTDSMALYDGYTYAAAAKGSGVGIMRFDGGTAWTQVNTDGFGVSGNYRSHAMVAYNGLLYVGTENGSGAQLWAYDTSATPFWAQVAIPGFSTNNTVIRSMAIYNGNLYLATNNSATGLEVWEFDGADWTQVNAGGFGNPNNVQAKSMVVHNGALYVGTDNEFDGGEIWKFNGSGWTPYILGGIGGDINNLYVNSMASFDGSLYAGTYNSTDGTEIWATSDSLPTYTLTYDASVMHLIQPDGSSNTFLVASITDFSGTLPDNIDTISVQRDGVDLGLTKGDFSFNAQFNEFYAVISGPPAAGTYTFTITAGATSVQSSDIQGTIHYLPAPRGGSLYPFDGTTVYQSTPTFSWQPVYYAGVTLYYRLEVALDNAGAPGDRVYATDRTAGMYHHTLPGGTLNPGQTYWWRVRVTDADNFIGTHNRTNTSWQQFTMASSIPSFSRAPGIIDDSWGVATFNVGPQVYLYFWVKVVDHEGISDRGSTHQVKVAFPSTLTTGLPYSAGEELMLYPVRGESYDSSLLGGLGGYRVGYYETGMVSLQGAASASFAGDYLFTVTDAGGNSASFTDTLNVAVLDPLTESTITVNANNNTDESLTATFDNVLVDGAPYDDFSGYSTIDDAIASGKWAGYGGDGTVSIVGGQAQISSPGKVGRSHTQLAFAPLPSVHSVQADVTVTAASSNGAPRARIYDVIYNNGSNDVYVLINVYNDRVTYNVNERVYSGNTMGWNILQAGDLLTSISAWPVTVKLDWNGSNLYLYANNLVTPAATFAPGGTTNPPTSPSTALQARIQFTTTVTPSVGWAAVPGANTYRVRIYNYDNSQIVWTGYTGGTSTRVPPGTLEPDRFYRLRLDARDAHLDFDLDNMSRTPVSPDDHYIFFTNSNPAVDPMIKFNRHGVYTWNNEYFGPMLSFHVRVHDAQGVPGNIKTVKVSWDDGGTPREEFLYYNDDPEFAPTATSGVYRSQSFQPAVATTYTFTAEDRDGNIVTTTEDLSVNPIDISPFASLVPNSTSEIPVMGSTGVNFDWADVAGAAFYRVEIFDKYGDPIFNFSTTDSFFNLAPGFLEEGSLYRYRITTRREFFEQNVDNGSATPFDDGRKPSFLTTSLTGGSVAPSLDFNNALADLIHYDFPAMGGSVYELEFTAVVTDTDGVPENIKSVIVTFPDTTTTLRLLYDGFDSPTKADYWASVLYSDPAMVQAGTYTFTVTDFDGNTAVTTDDLAVNVLPVPTGLRPLPFSSVAGTTPTIDWGDVPGAVKYMVKINDQTGSTVHESPFIAESYYAVPGGLLNLNDIYAYGVIAFAEDPDLGPGSFDNASATMPLESQMPHFMALAFVDSDTDGMDDNWEIAYFGNLAQDAATDADGDGLPDVDEYLNSTNPLETDTDFDLMPDGWEATYGLILLSDDSAADPDLDGRSNVEEYAAGTDPTIGDTVAPNNLTAGIQTASSVTLSWTKIPQTAAYEVDYAVRNDGPWTLFGTTADDAESITVTGLMPFTTYYFRLRTVISGPVYSPYTGVVSQGTLSEPPAPAPYTIDELAGTWQYHRLTSGDDPQWTGWEHGTMTMDAAGGIAIAGIDSDSAAVTFNSTASITSDGLVVTANSDNSHAVVSADRQLMVATHDKADGGYSLFVAIKDPAVTYAPTDMAGTWYVYQLVSGDFSAVPSQWAGWTRSTATIDGTGAYTATNIVTSAGPMPDDSGTFSITAGGELSETGNPSFHGFMNAAKNLVVFTENHDGNGYSMGVAIKRDPASAGTFSISDLLGTWYNHSLVAGDAPASPPDWYYETVTINTAGTINYYGTNADGTTGSGTEPFDAVIDGNGILTDSVDQLHGVMSDDKKLAVITQTDSISGKLTLTLLTKKSDDTDADGMEDGWEWAFFGDLSHDGTADSDGDGLSDFEEFELRTHPGLTDSDGDGMPDGWEVTYGLDPLVGDAALDADGDGLTNGAEYTATTDPTASDSDGDALSDGAEVLTYGTNPTLADTDGDTFSDGVEVAAGTNPLDPNSFIVIPGTYYVDIVNGTDDGAHGTAAGTGAWKTLHYAVARINEGTAGAYTLNVALGTYSLANGEADEVLEITQPNVTVIGEVGSGSVIDGSGTTNWNYGLLISADSVTIDNIELTQFNTGIFVDGVSNAIVRGCSIFTVAQGIYLWDLPDDTTRILQNRFSGILNTGIYIYVFSLGHTNSPDIQNNLFYAPALPSNDGIYIISNGSASSAAPKIFHNTIVGTGSGGGGIYAIQNLGSCVPYIQYNIITNLGYGVQSDSAKPASPQLEYNDIWNNTINYENVTAGTGDISQDPLFVDPAAGNFQLTGGSPAIDAIPLAEPDPVTVDLLGASRPLGSGFEMGAYEVLDLDGDGMNDAWENLYFGNTLRDGSGDFDGDGLTDLNEYLASTNPTNPDSDGDGMPDGWEADNGLNPLSDDSLGDPDGDSLNNLAEFNNFTDPNNNDSDADGLLDGEEVLTYGTDPTLADTDADTLNDHDEVAVHGTNPLDPDTDADGLTDDAEINVHGTDPLEPDSDFDGLNDGAEIAAGTDPLNADTDSDGLNDSAEITAGTNPLLDDTDGDGLLDGEEVLTYGTDPNAADTDADTLSDHDEVAIYLTNPVLADTDADGAADNVEIAAGTDPLNANSFPVLSGVYYVDIVNGTDDSSHGTSAGTGAWKTLHYAIDRINSGIPGSYTLNVGLGTYSVANGEPDAELQLTQPNVSVIGEIGSVPLIDGTGATNWLYGIWSTAASVFIENIEVTGDFEIGIKVELASSGAIRNCIVRNLSAIYAQGILLNEVTGIITVQSNQVSGIYTGVEAVDCSPILVKNLISDNDYGIIAASYGTTAVSPLIENNLIVSGRPSATGIYIHTDPGTTASPLIYHNTLHAVVAGTGAAIYMINTGGTVSPVIKYNVLTNWGAGIENDSGTPLVDYNDVWNNGVNFSGTSAGVNGISFDPRYVDPASGNYDLASGSLCIDAIPLTAGDTTNSDIAGQLRPLNNGYDMGCYESTGTANRPPATPAAESPLNESLVDPGSLSPPGVLTLKASDFSDLDGDSHTATLWQVRRYDRPYGAANETGPVTDHAVSVLAGMKYVWRVGYKDIAGNVSWSPEYFFKVGTPAIEDPSVIPAGTDVTSYIMVSFCNWPNSPQAPDSMGIVYDTTMVKIGTYNAISGGYIEYDAGMTVQPGQAYWFLSREGMDVSIEGVPVSMVEDIEVKLNYNSASGNGWNMISSPNRANYWWGDVMVVQYDSVGNVLFQEYVSNLTDDTLIDRRLWQWNAGSYIFDFAGGPDSLIEHHKGYWVRANQENVYLRFPKDMHARVSGTRIFLARMMQKGKWLITPVDAVAAINDTPPMPLGGLGGSGSAGAKPGSGGCFIATAAFGSPLAPHVRLLKDFRDKFLMPFTLGKRFVKAYYRHSPPLAAVISKHDNLRKLVRVVLLPIVGLSWVALNLGFVPVLIFISLFVCIFIYIIGVRVRIGNK